MTRSAAYQNQRIKSLTKHERDSFIYEFEKA